MGYNNGWEAIWRYLVVVGFDDSGFYMVFSFEFFETKYACVGLVLDFR